MAIARPNAEVAWVAWLRAGGFSQARSRILPDHVDGMIRVSRVGGKRLNLVQDSVVMLVETWHSSAFEASQVAHRLAERCEAAADGTKLDDVTRVANVVTTGPLEFPDPNSALVRYQFTVECLLRRTAA